ATAEEYTCRRGGEHHGVHELPQRVRDEVPGGMAGRQLRGRFAGARLDGGTRGQALETIAVVRAASGKIVARHARHADVAEFGVREPEDAPAAHDAADADARAHGDVREIVEP